jgi:hypothetical protein
VIVTGRSARPQEVGVPLLQPRWIRAIRHPRRQEQQLAVYLLQTHEKHWAVVLGQDRRLDFDDVVRPNREEEAVEGGVVKFAECHAIAYYRLAFRVAVWRDVGRIE